MLHLQWSTLVFQFLNFFVLLFVLSRFLYHPLMDAMRRRQEAVTRRVQDAEQREARADAERAALAEKARSAQAEADALLARAREEAARLKAEQQASARQDAARLLDEARQRIADEERAARGRLAADARRSAVAVTASLIGKVAGRPFHEALVAEVLENGLGVDGAEADLLRRALDHAGRAVTVESAYPLSTEATARLEELVAETLRLGRDHLPVTVRVDPALGAGVRIVVGVGVVDLSLRRTLTGLEREAATLEP